MKLTPKDLLSLEEYDRQREAIKTRLNLHKKRALFIWVNT